MMSLRIFNIVRLIPLGSIDKHTTQSAAQKIPKSMTMEANDR